MALLLRRVSFLSRFVHPAVLAASLALYLDTVSFYVSLQLCVSIRRSYLWPSLSQLFLSTNPGPSFYEVLYRSCLHSLPLDFSAPFCLGRSFALLIRIFCLLLSAGAISSPTGRRDPTRSDIAPSSRQVAPRAEFHPARLPHSHTLGPCSMCAQRSPALLPHAPVCTDLCTRRPGEPHFLNLDPSPHPAAILHRAEEFQRVSTRRRGPAALCTHRSITLTRYSPSCI